MPLQIDAQGNIYLVGNFATCSGADNYPARIENDVILLQDNNNCSTMFIAKFNGDGVMQWFKRPQVPGSIFDTFSLNSKYEKGTYKELFSRQVYNLKGDDSLTLQPWNYLVLVK